MGIGFVRRLTAPPASHGRQLTAAQRLLVRACLPTGAPGRAAFSEWTRLVGDPLAALSAEDVRPAGLMPLLLWSAERNGVRLDRRLRSVLRAARAHEELRLRATDEACREALAGEAVEPIVVRGVALGATAYPEPALRHCHDLDLLVAGQGGSATADNGFPVSRHVTLLAHRPGPGYDDVRDGARRAAVAGVSALVLDPADQLIHICGHAATAGVSPPLAAVDAWFLLDANPGLDWGRVREHAARWGVAGVVADRLGRLRAELAAPVPAAELARLQALAARKRPIERLRNAALRRGWPAGRRRPAGWRPSRIRP